MKYFVPKDPDSKNKLKKIVESVSSEISIIFDILPDVYITLLKEFYASTFDKEIFEKLEDKIAEAKTDLRSDKVDLVGHSLGGLKVFKYTLEHPKDVGSCTTVATPFMGTPMANIGYLFIPWGIKMDIVKQLSRGSYAEHFKKDFKLKLDKIKDIRFTNIIGMNDELVPVNRLSLIDLLGDYPDNVEEYYLEGCGHGTTFDSRFTYDFITNILKKSKQPMVLVHGFMMTEDYFDRFKYYLGKNEPGLIKKVKVFSYDAGKPI